MKTPDLRGVEYHRFARARSVHDYGYRDGKPIMAEPGIPLLPWEAIDDLAQANIAGRPPMYLVIGEDVGEARELLLGRKFMDFPARTYPRLAVSDAYMKWAGYERTGFKWRRQG